MFPMFLMPLLLPVRTFHLSILPVQKISVNLMRRSVKLTLPHLPVHQNLMMFLFLNHRNLTQNILVVCLNQENPEAMDKPEQTEELNYRETVRSVRSFMGWNHIPTFESDLSEPNKTNNPWKGKNPKRPSRISVAMPPGDWLCQKLEQLNCTVAEGYPSRSQDSAKLKKDQFVKMAKSQARRYQMHLIKPDGPHRPGWVSLQLAQHGGKGKLSISQDHQGFNIPSCCPPPPPPPPPRPISQ